MRRGEASMLDSVTRRKFCQSLLSGVAASGLGMVGLSGGMSVSQGIDPFTRTPGAKMKLSLAAYSFRQALTKKAGEVGAMDLFQLVDYCRAQQVPGVELTAYYFPEKIESAYLKRLRRHCHVEGVSISGGAIRNDFCVAADDRQKELDQVRHWLDVYAELGAPVIRIFAGSPAKNSTREEAIQRCIEACEIACEQAGERGILLALENHHGITDTAESMLEVVRGVKSPWFGVNFDSGNFHSTSDPYAELEMIAPYAINAQIKVDMMVGGKKVPADVPRIVQILDRAGYGGWVALEYEGSEEVHQAVPRHLAELAKLLD